MRRETSDLSLDGARKEGVLLAIFGGVALVGFAMQAMGALREMSRLLRLADCEKYFGLRKK